MERLSRYYLLYLILSALLIVVNSCEKDETDLSKPLSVEQINNIISKSISETGDFNWKDASDHMAWSAIIQGEESATIGYSAYPYMDEELESDAIQQIMNARTEIIAIALELERAENASLEVEDILLSEGEYFTHLVLAITQMETVKQLRQLPEVRFFEPNYDKYPEKQATER